MQIHCLAIAGLVALAACKTTEPPQPSVKSFETCVAAGGPVLESLPRQCVFAGQTFVESGTTGDVTVETFEIGPELLPCQGPFPQQCMIVNGEYFYDQIDGFTHVAGRTTVAEVERSRICDPAILNSCPQDAGPYSYRLIRVISQR